MTDNDIPEWPATSIDDQYPPLTDEEIRALGYEPTPKGWVPLAKVKKATASRPRGPRPRTA